MAKKRELSEVSLLDGLIIVGGSNKGESLRNLQEIQLHEIRNRKNQQTRQDVSDKKGVANG